MIQFVIGTYSSEVPIAALGKYEMDPVYLDLSTPPSVSSPFTSEVASPITGRNDTPRTFSDCCAPDGQSVLGQSNELRLNVQFYPAPTNYA